LECISLSKQLSLAPSFSRVIPVLQSSTRFNGFKLPFEKAVETARYPFSTAITGLKPGARAY
jgi:hypothetical protein